MNNKEIIRFLSNKKEVGITALYKKFSLSSPKDKQAFHTTLTLWEKNGALSFSAVNKSITILNPSRFTLSSSKTEPRSSDLKVPKPPLRLEGVENDFKIIVERHDLPKKFGVSCLKELEQEIWDDQKDLPREDLRDMFIITIDGVDSKDLDDAVSVQKSFFGGWTLGVHIADVSHYVPAGSALDNEARFRANSFYLINQVIPMLPQKLSNELCSLNPNEDKRTMSIFMNFDNNGCMKNYRIIPSLIRSKFRMTYDGVQQIIDGVPEKNKELVKNISLMDQLFRILHKKRLSQGSVDFNFKERKIILDNEGIPTKVYQKDRIDSERLIEEFMLSANIAVADFLQGKGLGIYRVHDIPPAEKYVNLKTFAAKQGWKLPEVPKPKDIQLFLESLSSSSSSLMVSAEIFALRSMAQAVYQRENIGHFGLGFKLYTHFTSPIRRYADLIVHRMLKQNLYPQKGTSLYTSEWLDKTCTYISARERVAMEAERDFYKIKSVRYMKAFEGQDLSGKISSIAAFGIFVELENTGVEAMVRYSDMKGYVVFDEATLSAKAGKKQYRLGDSVKIRLIRVNVERGFIDGELLE